MRQIRTVVGACVVATVLAGCGGGGDGGGGGGGGGSAPGKVVDGASFTMAISADPGNVDPQMSAAGTVFQLSRFAYDSLVHMDDQGKIVSGLATTWAVQGQQVTFGLKDGVTCADGTPFTAADVVANVAYVADPAHQSPLLGLFVPAGTKAAADGSTVTLTLAAPAPFVLQGLASLPMVCGSAVGNRSVLAAGTRGTGPYALTEVVPSDHYTYTLRKGYAWGPGGASTAEAGMPATVVVKVVPNETTAANLLLSGGLNAATVVGPDAKRLAAAKLFSTKQSAVLGEMWFNHLAERPGSDPAVRLALTQAVDLAQLQKVLTSGAGTAGTTFAAAAPVACAGTSIAAALPTGGVAKAKATLDAAGWKAGAGGVRSKDGHRLALTFVYGTALGSAGSSAAELAASTWKELGADVTMTGQDDTALLQTVFSSGNWDVTWLALNVSSPDQLVPFLSGASAPAGNNFAHVDNAEYTAGATAATARSGTEGCDGWLKAEAALVRDADVVPFANSTITTFGAKARFTSGDVVVNPTSIRMLAR